ncbi:MAG: hypothetical protein SOW92_02750, partial [Kiritimatiellia bacterium]|nr:hypothetical protein [Kiritimatiellia bacterium]
MLEKKMRLRPDGVLEFEEATADGGEALLALAKGGSDGLDAATLWVRQLTVEHIRKLVSISEDGGMPSQAVCMRSRPDELERLALLASVPPMEGGEYWSEDTLSSLYASLERALAKE